MSQPTRLVPPISDAGVPFWEATRRKVLSLPWCTECEEPFWYPRDVCPQCLSSAIEWREASGRGVVYASSTMPKPANPTMAERVPYVVALVDLAEGVRMMSNVVGCAPESVRIDMNVEVTWEELSDGRHLPLFTPEPEAMT